MNTACALKDTDSLLTHTRAVLKAAGVRVTKPRLTVLECLSRSEVPLQPAEILKTIQSGELENIDKVSVYRTLTLLAEHGLIHQVFPSGGYLVCTHCECDGEHLHVLTSCKKCGATNEIQVSEEVTRPLIQHLKTQEGFHPTSESLQIDGLCKECEG